MTSKEMESRSGVPRANIRYYEAEGLLTPVRAKNGYRDYSEDDLAVLEKIKLLRRLGVSVEELKELCAGRAELGPVLERRVAELQNERETLERVERVCGELRSAGETFATLDAGKYLRALDEGPAVLPLPKADAVPMETNMFKRLFARLFDGLLFLMLIFTAFALAGRNPSTVGNGVVNIILQAAIFLLEPLLIHLTGTTPGKALLGIRLESPEGRRLSYGEAVYRHLLMLWHALGLWIPIWSLVQAYRVFKRWTEDESQPWDADVLYTAKPYTWKRTVAYAAAGAAMVMGAEAVNCACQLPPNRGELTVAEFAENFNRQAAYMGMEFNGYLDEEGVWQEIPAPQNVIVIDMTGQWQEEPTFHYTVENGVLKAVTLTARAENAQEWLSLPQSKMLATVMAFTWAQKDAPFRGAPRGEILEQMQQLGAEGYTLRQAGTVISMECRQKGFYHSSDMGLLIPMEEAANDFAFTFRVECEE